MSSFYDNELHLDNNWDQSVPFSIWCLFSKFCNVTKGEQNKYFNWGGSWLSPMSPRVCQAPPLSRAWGWGWPPSWCGTPPPSSAWAAAAAPPGWPRPRPRPRHTDGGADSWTTIFGTFRHKMLLKYNILCKDVVLKQCLRVWRVSTLLTKSETHSTLCLPQ